MKLLKWLRSPPNVFLMGWFWGALVSRFITEPADPRILMITAIVGGGVVLFWLVTWAFYNLFRDSV